MVVKMVIVMLLLYRKNLMADLATPTILGGALDDGAENIYIGWLRGF